MKLKLLFTGLLALGLALPMHAKLTKAEAKSRETAKKQAIRAAKASRAKAHWTCPMHPEIDEPKSGQCPKCHMDLVKKEVKK